MTFSAPRKEGLPGYSDRDYWAACFADTFALSGRPESERAAAKAEHLQKFDNQLAAAPMMSADEASAQYLASRSAELKATPPNYMTEWKAAWPALAVLRGLKEGTPEYVAGERGHIAAMEQAAAKT